MINNVKNIFCVVQVGQGVNSNLVDCPGYPARSIWPRCEWLYCWVIRVGRRSGRWDAASVTFRPARRGEERSTSWPFATEPGDAMHSAWADRSSKLNVACGAVVREVDALSFSLRSLVPWRLSRDQPAFGAASGRRPVGDAAQTGVTSTSRRISATPFNWPKNFRPFFESNYSPFALTHYRPAMPFGNRKICFR